MQLANHTEEIASPFKCCHQCQRQPFLLIACSVAHRNRAQAMRVLCARVYEQQRLSTQQARTSERRAQGAGNADRNERIRTYNFAQVIEKACFL